MIETVCGIRVEIEEGKTGLWFGTSPDLRGLLVAEQSADAVRTAVPVAIAELERARAKDKPRQPAKR